MFLDSEVEANGKEEIEEVKFIVDEGLLRVGRRKTEAQVCSWQLFLWDRKDKSLTCIKSYHHHNS